ncbi:clathrin adaptor mu subunit [Phanerochaete sordida]|uniref:Clathrin adaptor mu subunit n=1 Tax=Phanerochaete sordida TaxID=48140 RepID=A0A9P3FY86_9APHY|nr:clathrin adaptor mu subunit [Phanerochaete sordida]
MAIDGLIILDPTGRAIIQSGFRSSSPAYPLLHIEALNSALAKASRPSDVDPVLYVSALELDTPSACCHIKHSDLRILCPVSGDVDPLYVFAFLQAFVDILREYFGQISAETLKDNFDVVYQLLEETLDASGHPSTTYSNALRDIVLPPSLLQKVLSVAGVTGLASQSSNSHPFASPIPWRKMGVRYNSNEVFFDVVEELRAVVNKGGVAAMSQVWGSVQANCRLSGTPDLLLSFANSQTMTDCSFHPCVRLQRWTRDKQLSFVPPDGQFTLMNYRYQPSGTHQVAVPFAIKASVTFDENKGVFDLTVSSRLTTRTIEKMTVDWFLGDGASSASCNASNTSSWTFDPRTKTLRWEMKNMTPSTSFTLRGHFISAAKVPRPAHAFRVKFDVLQHTFSALKVDQLKLTGELYKPYKGVRGRSMGDVEWRW